MRRHYTIMMLVLAVILISSLLLVLGGCSSNDTIEQLPAETTSPMQYIGKLHNMYLYKYEDSDATCFILNGYASEAISCVPRYRYNE